MQLAQQHTCTTPTVNTINRTQQTDVITNDTVGHELDLGRRVCRARVSDLVADARLSVVLTNQRSPSPSPTQRERFNSMPARFPKHNVKMRKRFEFKVSRASARTWPSSAATRSATLCVANANRVKREARRDKQSERSDASATDATTKRQTSILSLNTR